MELSRRSIRRLVAIGAAAVAVCALAAPSSASAPHARKTVAFGAKLTSSLQPSNSISPHACSEDTGTAGACTRVALAAYGRAGTGASYNGAFAPKNGTVHHIKIIAGSAGTFIPEIARVQLNSSLFKSKAKIVQKGKTLHYNGQGGQDNGGPYVIETFSVNLPVLKGDFLAVQSHATSFERCSSGGAQQLLYQPPLPKNGPYKTAPFHDGCFLLIEAVY